MGKKRFLYLVVIFGIILIFLMNSPLLIEGEHGPLAKTVVHSYDGKAWSLGKFKGKPLVLNFWASWCTACIDEMPSLNAMSQKYADTVYFIGLTVESPALDVATVVKKFNLHFPIAIAENSVLEIWKAYSLPTTYVINAKGEIVYSQPGTINIAELENALTKALAK